MSNVTIGVLHPGDMGSAVGAALLAGGHRVIWASADRSPATRDRAEAERFTDVGGLAALTGQASVIISVCPPHGALDLAREVAALGYRGAYVDGNAVAPGTAREIGQVIEASGGVFVDGGIIGPPPRRPGTSRF